MQVTAPPWQVPGGQDGTGQRPAAADSAESDADAGAEDDGVASGPALSWLDDDVLRTAPERQVLVVGETVVGRCVAGLLDRCGYDPVLAGANVEHVESAVSVVGPRSLDVLSAIGVAADVREHGTRVESMATGCTSAAGTHPGHFPVDSPTTGSDSVVVETATLRRLFDAAGVVERARTDACVDSIANADDGLVVEFGNGVREWFDVVVDTVGTGLLDDPAAAGGETVAFAQYERRVDAGARAAARVHDVWARDALVQCMPVPDAGEMLLRVTTPSADDGTGFDADAVAERFPVGRDALAAVTDVEPDVVRQASFEGRRLTRSAWGRGSVARCGVAACPVAPATGCRLDFGLEDAARVVTELGRGQRSLATAVDAYAADRSRALSRTRLRQQTTGSTHADARPESAALRALARYRAIALAAVDDSTQRQV